MNDKTQTARQKPYGTWRSAVTPDMAAAAAVRYGGVALDNGDMYWTEGRPRENGRVVIVRGARGAKTPVDILPAPHSARSRAHEYGGGAMAVRGGEVWFVNDSDQQIYHIAADGPTESPTDSVPRRLTAAPRRRFADIVVDDKHDCLFAVSEEDRGKAEPINTLACIDRATGEVTDIARGDDFYAAPALSPDGAYLSWLSWRHPNMPWDETVLWLAEVAADGHLRRPRRLLAKPGQAVFQPAWSPDGGLYFVNDPRGWWQLYRFRDCNDPASIERVCDIQAEMGLPLWQFGLRTYAFHGPDRVIATLCERGLWRLVQINTDDGGVSPLPTPYCRFTAIAADESRVAVIAAGYDRADEVTALDPATGRLLRCGKTTDRIPADCVSAPRAVAFPTTDGDTAYGFYYPPKNPAFTAPPDEKPPLLVMAHGGPTAATDAGLDPRVQFWSSRGFAVLDVNYRGSTGYGRAYREKLKTRWGIYDVDDVVAGARYLVEQGLADAERIAIRGGSAGGYTALAALTFTDIFTAGCSQYGIGDLESLARQTHKFEARYLDRLVAPYPRQRRLYVERSPIHHARRLSCPVLFTHGAEDKVVPPSQAQAMAAALREKGIRVELLIFPGEQHGFRRTDTIRKALAAELVFYGEVFHLATD